MRSALLASCLLVGGCDAFYQVRGVVRSCRSGEPIGGARVRLAYDGERGQSETDGAGRFRVAANDLPGDEAAELTVEHDGFRSASRTVHHSTERDQDVCLEPDAR